ncbi:ionotropic receptor 75a-like [Battus philenor]|uniref:ionotropic receptor 75a-like n=1 Tax=Battus philenor TaxID=42288 RepID=UPI0035CFABCC
MVGDVIREFKHPKNLIAVFCWSSYKKIKFFKSHGQNIIMQFSDILSIPPVHVMEPHTMIAVDLNCPNVSVFLKKSEEARYFHSPYRWIIFDSGDIKNQNNSDFVPKEIENINVYPDAEVMNINKIKKDHYILNFIYKVAINTAWRTERYGVWKMKNKLQKNNKWVNTTSIRRLDLNGTKITVAFVITNNDSMGHLTDGINDHLDTITKANILSMMHLIEFINGSKKFVFDKTWGYPQNNTWNGMMGYLVREEAEIGGTPMFFTTVRIPVVEFITSPVPSRSKFVFQQPKLSYENNLFLLPFRKSVWISIGGLLVLLFIILYTVAFWERKKNNDSKSDDAGILRASAADCALLIFGATCQQGSPVGLKDALGRIVLLILFWTVLFLYTSFSANIVALLQSSSSKIKTVEDLLQSRMKFGVEDNPYNRHYFATMTEPTRKALYETKIAPPGVTPRFLTMEDGVEKMRQGLFAFHMEIGVGYKFVGKYFEEGEKCSLYEIQYLQVTDPWIGVRKKSPYIELYKIGTKRLIEHGLQYRENHRWYVRRPTCSAGDGNFVSVSMFDCYPALLVLSYGTLIASALLIIEILYRRKDIILKKFKRSNIGM